MATTTTRTLLLSGSNRYADPWHPFSETSRSLERILAAEGLDVEVGDDVDAGLADLVSVDLLVLNVGRQSHSDSIADQRSQDQLRGYQERGGAILALHSTATSFEGLSHWEDILGGRWVDGLSMHPPQGRAGIHVYPERHEIAEGLEDFEVFDERYSYLRTAADSVVFATHDHDGAAHPIAWARERGVSRVVYVALGHDARSYESSSQSQLIARSVRWLLNDLG